MNRIRLTVFLHLLLYLGATSGNFGNLSLNQGDTGSLENAIKDLEKHLIDFQKDLQSTQKINTCQRSNPRDNVESFRNDVKKIFEKYSHMQVLEEKCNHEETLSSGIGLALLTLQFLEKDFSLMKNNVSELTFKQNLILEAIGGINVSNSPKAPFQKSIAKNCKEIKQKLPHSLSGIYEIQPGTSKTPFKVLCDMETDNGGWVVIQNRKSGIQDFYLPWVDYKEGFGHIMGDFWLGLENIYKLTNDSVNELLIELVDNNNTKKFAVYSNFSIGPEAEGYPLESVGNYQGTVGDSFSGHKGQKFTTFDKDQDPHPNNCAVIYEGAWWYNKCHSTNLNGKYLPGQLTAKALVWYSLSNEHIGIRGSRMLIRPRDIGHGVLIP